MSFKHKKITLLTIALVPLVLLAACNNKPVDTSTLMQDIKFEVISKNDNLKTDVEYIIQMTNDSDYKIVQNNVLFSFINDSATSSVTTNPFSILARGNQLNIEPGESVDLVFRFPSDYYKEFKDSEVKKANLYFTGYFDRLEEDTHFDFMTSVGLE